jgi:hypothetical protein
MSKDSSHQIDLEKKVVELIVQLIHAFHATKKIEFSEIGRLFFEGEYPELKEERRLVWEVINTLHTENHQISPRLIFSSLISGVVGIIIFNPYNSMSDNELADMARERVKSLLNYSSLRDIDIPIVSLQVDGPPAAIGKVTFFPISEADHKSEWWEKIKLNYSGNVDFEIVSYGRITSPGDWEIALDYAEKVIHESLLIIRGVSFPFVIENINQFGMINDFPVWPNQPYRLNKPDESERLEHSSNVITRLGPPIRIYRLYADLLNLIDSGVITTLNQLLNKDGDTALTEMQRKLLSGLRWIGEATKPDTLASRYLKISTALEYLIGGESSKEHLTTRGITATLAERAAFLLGENKDQRILLDREVKKFYGLRSKIVHGNRDAIDQSDFFRFSLLVRKIALALCYKISTFRRVEDLQKWVLGQRYT